MRSRISRQVNCRVCGSTLLWAEYRSEDVIYLSCHHCSSVWPVETDASRNESISIHTCFISEAPAVSEPTTLQKGTRRKAEATMGIAADAARRRRQAR